MRSRRGWLTLLLASMFVAAACGEVDERPPPAVRAAFAVEGSLESSFSVHIYRTTLPPVGDKGLVIQFHARGSRFRLQDDVSFPARALVICAHGVGPRASRLGDSCRTVALGAEFDLGTGDSGHTAVEVLAPGDAPLFISELVVGYEPADAFLGVEFPAR